MTSSTPALPFDRPSKEVGFFFLAASFGCCLLTLASFIRIPCYPVAMTLHTLALFLLALYQTPKQAFSSAALYLACGSLGLPVFAGFTHPLWFLRPSAGYLIAFPFAAYLIATLKKRFHPMIAIFFGQLLIYSFGFFSLSLFIGPMEAFTTGVLFFLPSALLKSLIASSFFLASKR